MTFKNYRRTHKFNASKTIVDNLTFDSIAEAEYYKLLKLLVISGDVIKFSVKPKFKFVFLHNATGKKLVEKFTPDFRVWFKNDKKCTIVDVKGKLDKGYIHKRKLMKDIYNINILEVTYKKGKNGYNWYYKCGHKQKEKKK